MTEMKQSKRDREQRNHCKFIGSHQDRKRDGVKLQTWGTDKISHLLSGCSCSLYSENPASCNRKWGRWLVDWMESRYSSDHHNHSRRQTNSPVGVMLAVIKTQQVPRWADGAQQVENIGAIRDREAGNRRKHCRCSCSHQDHRRRASLNDRNWCRCLNRKSWAFGEKKNCCSLGG